MCGKAAADGGRYCDRHRCLCQSECVGISLLGGLYLVSSHPGPRVGAGGGRTWGWCVCCRPAAQSCGLLPPFACLARLASFRPSLTWRIWGRVSLRARVHWPFSLSLSRYLSIIFTVSTLGFSLSHPSKGLAVPSPHSNQPRQTLLSPLHTGLCGG